MPFGLATGGSRSARWVGTGRRRPSCRCRARSGAPTGPVGRRASRAAASAPGPGCRPPSRARAGRAPRAPRPRDRDPAGWTPPTRAPVCRGRPRIRDAVEQGGDVAVLTAVLVRPVRGEDGPRPPAEQQGVGVLVGSTDLRPGDLVPQGACRPPNGKPEASSSGPSGARELDGTHTVRSSGCEPPGPRNRPVPGHLAAPASIRSPSLALGTTVRKSHDAAIGAERPVGQE